MAHATDSAIYSDLIVEALTRYADREAFVIGERRMTYRQASDFTARLVKVLVAHGVQRGTGVGALGPNSPEMWLVQAAAYLLGAHFTGLHPLGSVDDHVHVCDEAEVHVLVAQPVCAEAAGAIAVRSNAVSTLLMVGRSEAGPDLLSLCADVGAATLSPGPAGPDDVGWLQYTGGTTGRPKGVMLTQQGMAHQVQSWLCSFGVPESPRYLAAAPITHAAVLPVLPVLLRGGTIVLQSAFDPEQWLRTAEVERVNYAFAVPTMLYGLVDRAEPEAYDLTALETIGYGAAPISPTRLVELQARMGPVFLQGYGQTEAGGYMTVLRKDEHDPARYPELLTSCGRPAVGVRVEVLDEAGGRLPDGEVGELAIRSGGVMAGYWKQPELTKTALAGGWLHTGDLGRRDERGFFHIVDRAKDMLISGGFNVYPREVEDALLELPTLRAAAVIGVPHPVWGEAVAAVVVPKDGVTVDVEGLTAHVRERKGVHYAPKTVIVVEALPVTPAGKIDKRALRAAYQP